MKPYLTLITCGKTSEHQNWEQDHSNYGFDLGLIQYDNSEYADINSLKAEYTVRKEGMKFTLASYFFKHHPEAFDYKYVLVMDDDLVTSPAEIERFFETCDEHSFDLAQPGLNQQSNLTYPSTRKIEGAIYHLTPMVETMTPCFSWRILRTAVEDFGITTTGFGWGFEALWEKQFHAGKGMSKFGGKIGVIDNVDFGHYRAVRGNESGIYKKFGSPVPDMQSLLWRFGLQWHGGREFVTFEVQR